jgi:hypothetical protein
MKAPDFGRQVRMLRSKEALNPASAELLDVVVRILG